MVVSSIFLVLTSKIGEMIQVDQYFSMDFSGDHKIEPPKGISVGPLICLPHFCKRNEILKKKTLFLGVLLEILQGLW